MKANEWVYHEFTLGQVIQESGRFEFSDGVIRHAYDVRTRCFPLTMRIKNISEEYERWNKKLHEIPLNGLNFPDIHAWMVDHWTETCKYVESGDDKDAEYYRARYSEVREFCKQIEEACLDFGNREVMGIKLGRR